MLKKHLEKVAEEDFQFAMERYKELGYEELMGQEAGRPRGYGFEKPVQCQYFLCSKPAL